MTRIALAALFLLASCEGSAPQATIDAGAGPDTSCGVDCAAQERFGLIAGRCFEYSASADPASPAALGALVGQVTALEGGVKVIPLEYLESGQRRMTDFFILRDGDLLLARRTFGATGSVTYKDTNRAIVGAGWLKFDASAGQTFASEVQADVSQGATVATEPTTYRAAATAAATTQLATPLRTYDEGLTLLVSESPDHGSDIFRVFVAGVGFTAFSNHFSLTGQSPAREFRLQKVRDLSAPDGGAEACGFGNP